MPDAKDALESQSRLTLAQLEKDLEFAHRAVTARAAADGNLMSGGTIRKLLRALLEKLEEASGVLIAAHLRAGGGNPADVAAKVRGQLEPHARTFLEKSRKSLGRVGDKLELIEPDVQEFFDSLPDRATVAQAEYPTPTETVIAGLRPEKLPEGWERVQRTLDKARTRLQVAKDEEDFQSVGHLCREVLISVAQAVYKPERHPSPDGAAPSETDAKRQLEAFFAAELPGSGNAAMRSHAKSAVKLADALTHKRTATLLLGSVCLEATSSVVNLAAIVSVNRE